MMGSLVSVRTTKESSIETNVVVGCQAPRPFDATAGTAAEVDAAGLVVDLRRCD